MPGLTNLTADALLVNITTAYPYMCFFTAVGSDAGTGFTEAAYTGYTRENTTGDWGAPSGTSPSSISNSSAIDFPICTNTGTAIVEVEIAWGMVNNSTAAISSTSLGAWDYLGSANWTPFTCTAVGSGNGTVLTVPGYTPTNGDIVVIDEEYGGTLPTFTQSNFTGQLTVANASGNTFTVTNASTAVWTSTIGSGMLKKITPQSVVPNGQPIINIGSCVINGA
jgi:hypothetical protein